MGKPTLPEWYSAGGHIAYAIKPKRNRAAGAVRRALGGFGEAIASQLTGSHACDSWVSKINPSAKVAGIIILIVAITALHTAASLAIAFTASVVMAITARIDRGRIARIWLGVPMFSLAVIIPSMFNIITPGDILLPICRVGDNVSILGWNLPPQIGITMPGVTLAMRFLLRVAACITFALLLTATTNPTELVNGLRRLGLPKVFGMVFTMMQRYLTVMLRAAEEVHLAKLSRTIDSKSVLHEQKWAAAGIGSLLRKTYQLTEEIHNAMISRGYSGNYREKDGRSMQMTDWIWMCGCLIASVSIVVLDRAVI